MSSEAHLQALWNLLKDRTDVTCRKAASDLSLARDSVVSALKSLEAKNVLSSALQRVTVTRLTPSALDFFRQGAPEVRLVKALQEDRETHPEGLPRSILAQKLGDLVLNLAQAQAIRNHWVEVVKKDKKDPDPVLKLLDGVTEYRDEVHDVLERACPQIVSLASSGTAVEDLDEDALQVSDSLSAEDAKYLKLRKLSETATVKYFKITKGPNFARGIAKPAAELTSAMLSAYSAALAANEDPAEALQKTGIDTITPLNFNALGALPCEGALHPLMQVRRAFVEIFTGLGFEQMPTPLWCESSFFNFDALFQPQQHPARDAHDTFFIAGECATAKLEKLDREYLEAVRRMHEQGDPRIRSSGYRYHWDINEALKCIMRTHTTAVSARMLYRMGKEYKRTGVFTPKKYFSIDRVFRNETLDATHLCEFHQVEGFIVDFNLNLGNLIAAIREFFEHLGIKDIKFKPTYNPYTAPSMEVFAFHPGLGRLVEMGNSGMFRPEMLAPMGLPEGVTCIAWGLSLERPTMIAYGIDNIRDLIGPSTDLDFIGRCGFFKDASQATPAAPAAPVAGPAPCVAGTTAERA